MGKDDAREYDWAERNIRAMRDEVSKLKARIATVESLLLIHLPEEETGISATIDGPGISQYGDESLRDWTSRQLDKLGAGFSDLEQRVAALEAWPRRVRLTERITALENGSRLVGTPMFSPPFLAGDSASNEDFSPPIGDRFTDRRMEEKKTGVGRIRDITETALADAERRVRDYMKRHFSEATIGGVVQAIRGEVWTRDNPQG